MISLGLADSLWQRGRLREQGAELAPEQAWPGESERRQGKDTDRMLLSVQSSPSGRLRPTVETASFLVHFELFWCQPCWPEGPGG